MTPARAFATALVLAVAAAAFMLGVLLPIVRLDRFFLFSDAYSVVTMIGALFGEGEFLLGAILLVFSLLLPAAKIMLLSWLLVCGADMPLSGPLASLVGLIGKWAMLDVLLVALVIFAVRTSGVGSAVSQPGLYFFVLSVLMTMAGSAMVRRRRG